MIFYKSNNITQSKVIRLPAQYLCNLQKISHTSLPQGTYHNWKIF